MTPLKMNIFLCMHVPLRVGTPGYAQQPHPLLACADFGWALRPMDMLKTFPMLVLFHPPTKLLWPLLQVRKLRLRGTMVLPHRPHR